MKNLTFHPIADIFPMMPDKELSDLAADIQKNGMHSPIMLDRDGRILDGRNRYRACEIIGEDDPQCEVVTGDALAYVISSNLFRRHLSSSQRSMVAGKIANMRQGERTDLTSNDVRSQGDAAKLLNVSLPSVQRAATVLHEAAPNVIAFVERGDVSVNAAAKAVKAVPKEEQKNWTAADIKQAAKDATPSRQNATTRQAEPPPSGGVSTPVKQPAELIEPVSTEPHPLGGASTIGTPHQIITLFVTGIARQTRRVAADLDNDHWALLFSVMREHMDAVEASLRNERAA